jgi:hypothetical protein
MPAYGGYAGRGNPRQGVQEFPWRPIALTLLALDLLAALVGVISWLGLAVEVLPFAVYGWVRGGTFPWRGYVLWTIAATVLVLVLTQLAGHRIASRSAIAVASRPAAARLEEAGWRCQERSSSLFVCSPPPASTP